jgi:hypothetical protein
MAFAHAVAIAAPTGVTNCGYLALGLALLQCCFVICLINHILNEDKLNEDKY